MLAFPKYESYKDSGVDWLGEIPNHWSVKAIKYTSSVNPSGDRAQKDEQVTFLPMEAVWANGEYDVSKVDSRHIFPVSLTEFKQGDVLLAKITPCFENGKGAFLEKLSTDKGIGSTEFHVFRVHKNQLGSRFLYYVIHNQAFRSFAKVFMEGTAGQKRVTTPFISNTKIPIPSLEEQRRIVDFLDRKTAEIDQAIAQKQRLIELLKEQKAILIDRAVTQGIDPNVEMRETNIGWLNKIPSHWKINRIKRLFSEIDDRSVDGKEILLSLRMYAGLVPHNDVSDKPIESNALVGYRRVNRGELVMNRMRAAIGLFGVADISGIVSPDYAVFRKIEDIHMDFYLHLFKTESMKKIFFLESKGIGTGSSGFLRLYSDKFGTIKVPVAPMEEQKRILNYIQEVESEHSILEKKTEQEINCLVEIKNILICDSVTGKMKL